MLPIKSYVANPTKLGSAIVKHFGQWLPDSVYLKLRYRMLMGRRLNLKNPRTFQEKLQWLKLHDRNPEYTKMVDKILVKEYVASIIGKEYVIPLLGVWDRAEDIEWDVLPNQFVLKTNHSGGNTGVVICKDISSFDRQSAIAKLNASLAYDIFKDFREWPYKDVERKVFAEEYIEPATKETWGIRLTQSGERIFSASDLLDYKFFCFNGIVKFFKIDFDRLTNHHANYYDREGRILPFGELDYLPIPNKQIDIPLNLQEMIKLAEKLSKDKKFVRIDFYNIKNKIYFGEITFYPASGFGKFEPKEWDWIVGKMLDLHRKKG